MITKKTIKLFGVAGAGKTTKCVEHIKSFIKDGYDIEDICFTTYTKAGIRSILDKLKQHYITIDEKKNNFRTINSLTWRLSGFEPTVIVHKSEQRVFFESINIKTESEDEQSKSEMDIILALYDRILNSEGMSLNKIDDNTVMDYINYFWIEYNVSGDIDKSQILSALIEYNKWKDRNNKKSYVDSIIYCIENKIDIPNKILIVDEAQDLSKAQTMLVDLWSKEFERDLFIIAGDDDQTVHEWNGATPNYLINYENNNMEKEILEYSYRLPKNISEFCNNILNTILYREEKIITSDKQEGIIDYLYFDDMQFLKFFLKLEADIKNKGKTMYLLFRTRRIMNQIQDLLFNQTDIAYGVLGDKEQSKWSSKFITLCNALNKIRSGKDLNIFEIEALFSVLPTDSCLVYGAKSKIKKMEDKNQIIKNIDLLNMTKLWSAQRTLEEYSAGKLGLDIKNEMINYIKYKGGSDDIKIIKQNENYQNKLRNVNNIFVYSKDDDGRLGFVHNIELGTYHSSKGLEADNVVVFLGTSYFFKDIDDSERRCFYVACSRAKENLYFISSYNMDTNVHKDFLEVEFEVMINKTYPNNCYTNYMLQNINKH